MSFAFGFFLKKGTRTRLQVEITENSKISFRFFGKILVTPKKYESGRSNRFTIICSPKSANMRHLGDGGNVKVIEKSVIIGTL
jgi:hypothetical protein